jgi:hypothetical protein
MTRIGGEKCGSAYLLMRLYKPFSNRVQYPSDSPSCQQFCGRQTLPNTAAYLPNDRQPISAEARLDRATITTDQPDY